MKPWKIGWGIALACLMGGMSKGMAQAQSGATPLMHRVFASSHKDIDRTLSRPYDGEVPFGASGDCVWATNPQGWAFREGVQLVYATNLNVFDLVVFAGGKNYVVQQATYMPSHVHMIGGPGENLDAQATASFTFTTDRVENPLIRPFKPEKRWTCWSSGHRTDWYSVDFGRPRLLTGVDLYFFSDVDQGGGCAPPSLARVELFVNGSWRALPSDLRKPAAGKNTLVLDGGKPVRAERVRLTFQNAGTNLYTGLYGFDPRFLSPPVSPLNGRRTALPLRALTVTGDKWITQNDILVSRLTVNNASLARQPFFVRMESPLNGTIDEYSDRHDIDGFPLFLHASGTDGKVQATHFQTDLNPGETRVFTFACAVAKTDQAAMLALQKSLIAADPLRTHISAYQDWFNTNTAYFDCSDPLVSKLYYHRWYNVKKNSMDPQLGALHHRTFSEGRWTSDWYANVISYGAGHQIREARWLRDPSYAWGHLQTWTDNPRPDGIYPSHITPKGQQGGQYTDWITSTAWDLYEVHPLRPLLASVADTLIRNAEGWRRVYGLDDSPLLVVDSHWWTGMEWQPSFFSFSGYHTSGKDADTHLRRVDLTAYNFGNAQTAARVCKELGREVDAERMQKLADETRAAMLEKMWNPETRWFHSLRASDNAKAPPREIIGLYPFYFDLPPRDKGYEQVWDIALDPALFWTPWPLASAAKDTPAYAQNGWPVGPGGSICMWNGPTWPHANSLVLTAMANTLRHYAPCALNRQKMLDLFLSFTRAQFKDQNPEYPWTGEYYNGDTGAWKTTQRDYNHSTWIDPLVSDLLGLVPRADNILEIDPLLPEGAWSYWILDGQAYRGHDVTIAFDAIGGHIAAGLQGFEIYLDGKKIYHGDRPAHVLYDMDTHKRVVRK